MKQKRTGYLLMALLLVVGLGIGYAAASTDTVEVTGSAAAMAGDFNIEFDNEAAPTTNKVGTNTTVQAAYTSKDVATMTVSGLQLVGDNAEAIFKVKNASNTLKADVVANLTGDLTSENHFTNAVTYSTDGTAFTATAPTNVVAGSVIYVKVNIGLATAGAEAIDVTNFTVTVTGTAVE